MTKSSAEYVRAHDERRRARGETRCTVWIPDTDTARSAVAALAKQLLQESNTSHSSGDGI